MVRRKEDDRRKLPGARNRTLAGPEEPAMGEIVLFQLLFSIFLRQTLLMRTIAIAVAFLVLIGGGVLSACHKSNSPGSYMSAEVNGVSFSRSNCVYIWDSGTFKSLSVFGADYNPGSTVVGINTFLYPEIKLSILDFTGVGIYAVTDTFKGTTGGNPFPTKPVASAVYATGDTTFAAGIYGTITITATSPKIVGTFSFTTADSMKVINGKFTATSH